MKIPDLPHVAKAAKLFRYARIVFAMPPWREIYRNDAERKQDFAEAVASYDASVATYREFGYEVMDVPRLPVQGRTDFILMHLERS